MGRSGLTCLLVVTTLLAVCDCQAEPLGSPSSDSPPLVYDLLINGESFTVEANRRTTLKSQTKPGVTYDVAIQIAMQQQVKLDRLVFDYEWPAAVQESRRNKQRTVQIRHELGFTVLLTDLGPALDAKSQEEALKITTDSMTESLRESGVKNLEVGSPRDWKFTNTVGRGVRLHYEDQQATAQTGLVFLLGGANFSASCIVQYFDASTDNVLPRVKKILDSIRAVSPPSHR